MTDPSPASASFLPCGPDICIICDNSRLLAIQHRLAPPAGPLRKMEKYLTQNLRGQIFFQPSKPGKGKDPHERRENAMTARRCAGENARGTCAGPGGTTTAFEHGGARREVLRFSCNVFVARE